MGASSCSTIGWGRRREAEAPSRLEPGGQGDPAQIGLGEDQRQDPQHRHKEQEQRQQGRGRAMGALGLGHADERVADPGVKGHQQRHEDELGEHPGHEDLAQEDQRRAAGDGRHRGRRHHQRIAVMGRASDAGIVACPIASSCRLSMSGRAKRPPHHRTSMAMCSALRCGIAGSRRPIMRRLPSAPALAPISGLPSLPSSLVLLPVASARGKGTAGDGRGSGASVRRSSARRPCARSAPRAAADPSAGRADSPESRGSPCREAPRAGTRARPPRP